MTSPAEDRPDLRTFIAWNADPNSGTTPIWTEIGGTPTAPQLTGFDELMRGRQYELGETQTAQPTLTLFDPNEYLNPDNTSSPYYPNVQPYREVLMLGVWPNDGAGNLLNVSNWTPDGEPGPDTTFESYVAGASCDWVTKLPTYDPGTTPTVTTTNPSQGAQCLTYPMVTAEGVASGIAVDLPCVPGEQYTASAYVRQTSANTQILSVDSVGYLDGFDDRTLSASWGSAPIGGAYANSGAVAAAFDVADGWGTHERTVATRMVSQLGSATVLDMDVTVLTGFDNTAADPEIYLERRSTSNELVRFGWNVSAGLVRSYVLVAVGGVSVASDTQSTGIPFDTDAQIWIRAVAEGTSLTTYIWRDGEPESSAVAATVSTGVQPSGVLALCSVAPLGGPNARFTSLQGTGYLAGTTTATTGAYARISCTFTASQPTHTMHLTTRAASVTGTVNVDAVMHEVGGAATAYDDEGATVYPITRAYAERYSRTWRDGGFTGIVEVPCVDALSALNAIALQAESTGAIAATLPTHWWPLSDGGDTTVFTDRGTRSAPLFYYPSKYGPGIDPTPGTAVSIVGDPGGTGVKFEWDPLSDPTTAQGTALAAGIVQGTPKLAFPSSFGVRWAVSLACWIVVDPDLSSNGGLIVAPRHGTGTAKAWVPVALSLTGLGAVFAILQTPDAAPIITATPAGLNDGLAHHLVATTRQDATNTTVSVYLDGALSSSMTSATSTVGGLWSSDNQRSDSATVGSSVNQINPNITVKDVALWERELSAAEILTLFTAGATGFAGETPGARIAGHLAAGGYYGGSNIDTESASTMQAPSWSGAIDLLTDTQECTTVEGGTLWVAPTGAVTMEGRARRFLRLTSQYMLGEDTAAGEIPYGDGITYDYDPQFIYADVRVERAGGAKTVGGQAADIATARRRFFPRSYETSGDYGSDAQAQYKADWTFYSHAGPTLRVASITIDPASNPSLWDFCLRVEVGNRVIVRRRAKAANAGAGITMAGEFFVETVKAHNYDANSGTWLVTLLLSPTGTPGISTQPWILGDSTWSVLDSTTIPGY